MVRTFETVMRESLLKNLFGLKRLAEGSLGEYSLEEINNAFLVLLSGKEHPLYSKAFSLFQKTKEGELKEYAGFYEQAAEIIKKETEEATNENEAFRERLSALSEWLSQKSSPLSTREAVEKIWSLFFPEGVGIYEHRDEMIQALRQKRRVRITQLNPSPIRMPDREILFTSNILLTLPSPETDIKKLPLADTLKDRIYEVLQEEQLYWYDHPVQIGVEPDKNEIIYGLRGLSEALRFEKKRGTVEKDTTLCCLLSVSVTHKGLQSIAREYIEGELNRVGGIEGLDIYVFTEADTERIIEDIIEPASERYMGTESGEQMKEVFGVDGEYGRHYSFLKAVAALWQVFVNPALKGTFKIDLDQVFPQEELLRYTKQSALEHLMTPLWGAQGIDSKGMPVELGMIAGALVNQKDIGKSLFTPDVPFPERETKADEVIFFSTLPQALSTEAEMMSRYNTAELDGRDSCIQRVHVTGGTTGILIDSLRKYRPFTPTFIGRAEDQAYIMSILYEGDRHLRYLHKDGLIMRHDKETFAEEAIKAAKVGKIVGDYLRIIWFSYYARALPWSTEEIKEFLNPFTGCFISPIPFTIAYLRLSLKVARLFEEGSQAEATELLNTGKRRLATVADKLLKEPDFVFNRYNKEKELWNLFYNILDSIEKALSSSDPFAKKLQERFEKIVKECCISGQKF